MNGNIRTQDYGGPRHTASVTTAPVVMVVLAATMIGASSGALIADGDALLHLKTDLASQLASVRGCFVAAPGVTGAEPVTPNVIPTGLSSIVAVQYSSKPDSARMVFDLRAADLVRTGKLRNPDRIYFDLQDRGGEQGTLKRAKKQKTIGLAGNLLKNVRISQRNQGATRIVLDLLCSCDFTYQTSSGPGSRLIVEVRPRPAGDSASKAHGRAS